MIKSIDEFVDQLQDLIFDDARAAYGELGFNRWRHPLYRGKMTNPDGYGRLTGTCGDTMEIFLKFKNGTVEAASFLTDGCGASTVCGSLAAEFALGKTPEELADVTGEMILAKLDVFPEDDEHCAFLAAATVIEALSDYMKIQVTKQVDGKERPSVC